MLCEQECLEASTWFARLGYRLITENDLAAKIAAFGMECQSSWSNEPRGKIVRTYTVPTKLREAIDQEAAIRGRAVFPFARVTHSLWLNLAIRYCAEQESRLTVDHVARLEQLIERYKLKPI
jgi:hypothetical protein